MQIKLKTLLSLRVRLKKCEDFTIQNYRGFELDIHLYIKPIGLHIDVVNHIASVYIYFYSSLFSKSKILKYFWLR